MKTNQTPPKANLEANNFRLEEALLHAKSYVNVIGLDGKIIYANRAPQGIDKNVFLNGYVYDFFPEATWLQFKAHMNTVKRTKTLVEYDNSFLLNGRKLHFSNVMSPVMTDGEVTAVVIMSNDLTELKSTQLALSRMNARLDAVLSSSPSFVLITDLEGNNLYVNRVAPGLDKETFLNGKIFDFLPEGSQEMTRKNLELVKKTRETTQYEAFYDINGRTNWFLNIMSPVFVDDEVTSVVIITANITETKEARFQLEARNKELARKNKDLEEFTYVASHDLREPIRTIVGFSQMLQTKYKQSTDSSINKSLTFILQSAQRMEALVNSLLLHSRVGREEKIVPVDLNELVNNIWQDFSAQVNKVNASLEVDHLPIISGYPIALRQLFQNLISNAIKYRREEVAPIVIIKAKEAASHWAFSVSDNGVGIPEVYQDRIFQLFQRLDEYEDREGSGIGLSICKRCVNLHDGTISISSTVGKGSTFHFTLSKS